MGLFGEGVSELLAKCRLVESVMVSPCSGWSSSTSLAMGATGCSEALPVLVSLKRMII